MIALILCGGLGTRMRPFTHEMPKSMLSVQGKPLLEHLINFFRKCGISEILLSVGYLKGSIKDYFKDGSGFGVKIHYLEEDAPLGTAGPLVLAKPFLKNTFIVCNGDMLYNVNLKGMIEIHRKNHALITIGLTAVQDPSTRGVVRMDGNRIVEFVEKAENPPSNLINAGIYAMEPEIFEFIRPGRSMLEIDVFPKVAVRGRLYGFRLTGQMFDIGTPERYETAEKEWEGVA